MTNMALPSGYQQITTGIQFRAPITGFRNFTAYIDTGCNGMTSGPEGTTTINGLTYELNCRRDLLNDSVMDMGCWALYGATYYDTGKYAPVHALWNVVPGQVYTSTEHKSTVVIPWYNQTTGGVNEYSNYRLVSRRGENIILIKEAVQRVYFRDPYTGYNIGMIRGNDSREWVDIAYVPSAFFGVNFNDNNDLFFNYPDDIVFSLEGYKDNAWHTLRSMTVSYEPQVRFGSVVNVSGENLRIDIIKNSSTHSLFSSATPLSTITYQGNEYKVYPITFNFTGGAKIIGLAYADSNNDLRGVIATDIPSEYFAADIETPGFPKIVVSQLVGYYSTDTEYYYSGHDQSFNSFSVKGVGANYQLYCKYNRNKVVSHRTTFANQDIQLITDEDIVTCTRTPLANTQNIRVGAFPAVYTGRSSSEEVVTDYILSVRIWDENDTLISEIIPVINENTGDLGFYDLVKDELATVVFGWSGEYMSAAGEVAILHNMPKVYIKIGNNLEEFNSAYIKNTDLIGLSSSDVMEVKHI